MLRGDELASSIIRFALWYLPENPAYVALGWLCQIVIIMLLNPYIELYSGLRIPVGHETTYEQVQIMSLQLAQIHSAMGIVMKDMIKIMAIKCRQPDRQPERQTLDTKVIVPKVDE